MNQKKLNEGKSNRQIKGGKISAFKANVDWSGTK
jgi:hypothetical protein